ncbi:hypothetical protein JCM18918_3710 [Cutibacterium acnes JCM 18918]|nr:hypothetical protein JCM18918_3710 [Cutibacterium acnes JCM 18918]
MRTRDDRGAAAPEYIAILLIAAMFTSAVAVGVKRNGCSRRCASLGGYLREGFVCSGEPGEAAGPAAA